MYIYRSGNPVIKAVKPHNLNASVERISLCGASCQLCPRQKTELKGAESQIWQILGYRTRDASLTQKSIRGRHQSTSMEEPAWTPEDPLGSMLEHSVMEPSCPCQSSLLFFSRRCCFPSRLAETDSKRETLNVPPQGEGGSWCGGETEVRIWTWKRRHRCEPQRHGLLCSFIILIFRCSG